MIFYEYIDHGWEAERGLKIADNSIVILEK